MYKFSGKSNIGNMYIIMGKKDLITMLKKYYVIRE